jgi:hypothetical protein
MCDDYHIFRCKICKLRRLQCIHPIDSSEADISYKTKYCKYCRRLAKLWDLGSLDNVTSIEMKRRIVKYSHDQYYGKRPCHAFSSKPSKEYVSEEDSQ